MRRTLALFGVAALAVVGLAGPANASDVNAQTDIVFAQTGHLNTGVEPDTSAPDHDQAWFDLVSTSGSSESLGGLAVQGCIADSDVPVVFINAYAGTDLAPPASSSDVFKTADPGYTGNDFDLRWGLGESGSLSSEDFYVELTADIDGVPADVIDETNSVDPDTLSSICMAEMAGPIE